MITTENRSASALDTILANINHVAGPTPGTLDIYTGAAPADLDAAATGTHLCSCQINDGSHAAFGATDNETLIATGYVSAGIWAQDTNPANTGTAGYWRITDYTGAAVAQGSVSLSGGGGELVLSSLTITAGVPVQITSFTVQITGIY